MAPRSLPARSNPTTLLRIGMSVLWPHRSTRETGAAPRRGWCADRQEPANQSEGHPKGIRRVSVGVFGPFGCPGGRITALLPLRNSTLLDAKSLGHCKEFSFEREALLAN